MDYVPNVPLDPADATRLIKNIARFGTVKVTKHCREDSMPDRGFQFQDLVAVLLNGEVKRSPEYDSDHDTYKYRVEGTAIDDDERAVAITVILSEHAVLVVTIF